MLVPTEASAKTKRVTSMMTRDEFNEIHDLFIDAAQMSPDENIDADVQVSNFCSFFGNESFSSGERRNHFLFHLISNTRGV